MAKFVKSALVVLPILMLAGGAFAAWQMFWADDYGATVTSEETILEIVQTFSDMALNTTLGPDSAATSAEINNPDGNISMTASLVIDRIDVTDGCTDYENDCTVTTMFNGVELNDMDNVIVLSGANTLNSTVDCARFSCPQTLNVSVLLSE